MMELVRTISLLVLSAIVSEASSSMRRAPKDAHMDALQVHRNIDTKVNEKASIQPELEPVSDQKFMKKDLPWDARPKADRPNGFHFKHPYPIVQDSGDYDVDYVKDENSDNGNWKAQETYDRLRMELAREKRDLAKAAQRQHIADKELDEIVKKHGDTAEERRKAEAARRALGGKHAAEQNKEYDEASTDDQEIKKASHTNSQHSGKALIPAPESKDVDAATARTKDAVDSLEDCKKQLAEAREKLKKLMDELEAGKKDQEQASAAVEDSAAKELASEKTRDNLKQEVQDEYADYLAAKKAYEEQLMLVQKLEAEIKAAAEKVKDLRDAEDPGGGVYNTPDGRSGVVVAAAPKLLALAVMGLVLGS